jgi:hypothetical protein
VHLAYVQAYSSPAYDGGAAHASGATRVARVVALAAFAAWVWAHMRDPSGLMHGSLLVFHEAGHVLFMPFGEFLMVLGGSLFQLLVPAFFVGYFAWRRDPFAVCFAALYLAASMVDVGVYIADARAGELPLLGGERSNHDWTYLLIELNALEKDTAIGGFVQDLAAMLFWLCTAAGLWIGWQGATPPRSGDRARGADARTA